MVAMGAQFANVESEAKREFEARPTGGSRRQS